MGNAVPECSYYWHPGSKVLASYSQYLLLYKSQGEKRQKRKGCLFIHAKQGYEYDALFAAGYNMY
jgi:hypothetical protein